MGAPEVGAPEQAAGERAADALVEIRISMPEEVAAQELAQDLVSRRLAACVQRLGPMTSVYAWEGEVEQSTEWLLLVKTTEELLPAVSDAVVAAHPYEVPEILAVPVTHSLEAYAVWLRDALVPSPEVAG